MCKVKNVQLLETHFSSFTYNVFEYKIQAATFLLPNRISQHLFFFFLRNIDLFISIYFFVQKVK